MLSYELGERFNSPTVNLFFKAKDYIKFLENLNYYLQQTLIEIISDKEYPVAKLGDITIYFMHYSSFDEAKKIWEKRCIRINRDNLYVIFVQQNGCTEDILLRFDNLSYKHKLALTAQPMPAIKCSYYIPNSEQSNGDVMDLCKYKGKFTGKRWIIKERNVKMTIIHYALGFPPYRSGGLTKFCVDLMEQQAKAGYAVAMLWPGQIRFINKKTVIKNRGEVSLGNQVVLSLEVINPLPISYDEGIADISAFTADAGIESYDELLNYYKPDVIHIHTLMGLHRSFLVAAKSRNIRLVFSAHDFFPICSKVTMFRHGAVCDSVQTCEDCGVCNATALNIKKIQILQSPVYRKIKDSMLIKQIRKKHRDNYLNELQANGLAKPVGTANDYKNLRAHFYSLLKMMDMIHYNSSITKKVYESVFELPNNCIVNITHSDIKDNRRIKEYLDDKLRIRYLGSQSSGKGFRVLKAALDELWSKRQDFCLDVHFTPTEISPYINVHNRYSYSDIKMIFEETDILVAPSMWYETFGFTVLEAISYGVPVIISETVGAKDILVNGSGIVVENITPEKLCSVFQNLTAKKLRDMNNIIVKKQGIIQIDDMSEQIEKTCYKDVKFR